MLILFSRTTTILQREGVKRGGRGAKEEGEGGGEFEEGGGRGRGEGRREKEEEGEGRNEIEHLGYADYLVARKPEVTGTSY